MTLSQRSEQIASNLLQIQAIFLRPAEPFTWASGIQSPIYCDNRLIYAHPEARRNVEEGFIALVREKFPSCEALMGTSTSGIGHAAIIAWELGLPMGYVRGGAKLHGRGNQIEGLVKPGQNVVVVEDLISTAGSVLEVVDVLRTAEFNVLGIVSIFTYGMKQGSDRLKEAKIDNISLTNFDILLEVAIAQNHLSPSEKQALQQFRDNPQDPSWMDLLN